MAKIFQKKLVKVGEEYFEELVSRFFKVMVIGVIIL